MSLRENFLKAQKDGYESLLAVDWKTASDKLADFASKIPAAMKEVTSVARTGAILKDEQKNGLGVSFSMPTLPESAVDLKSLEAVPGYRRLHSYCQSDDADICLYVNVSGSGKDRFGKALAYISVMIDPAQGFEASELTSYTGGDYSKVVKSSIAKPLPADGQMKNVPGNLNL